jgi:predicted secreted Zn-dependent protease
MEGIGQDWRKSSYSGNGGADCVEVGHTPGRILVRDTKHRDGPTLTFPVEAWRTFVAGIRNGESHHDGTGPLP